MQFRSRPGIQKDKAPSLATVRIELPEVANSTSAKLRVRLRFNEDDITAALGVLRYQLKKAAVVIDFEDCEGHSVNEAFDSTIDLEIDQKHEFEVSAESKFAASNEDEKAFELSGEGIKFSGKETNSKSRDANSSTKHKVGMDYTKKMTAVGGTPNSLRFSFETAHPGLALRGSVRPEDWCSVSFSKLNSRISAKLTAAPSDIMITGVGGIWPKDLSESKRFLVRLLALSFLDVKSYISVSELHVCMEDQYIGTSSLADAISFDRHKSDESLKSEGEGV